MALTTIYETSAPVLSGVSFDAVFEDTITLDIGFTQYSIEAGAFAKDHGIVQPMKYSLTGAVSNNPLVPSLAGISAGVLSNITESGVVANLAGSVLSSTDGTRASTAWELLTNLARSRIPFDVDTVDAYLTNMVITSLRRTRSPENENALIFVADLQELPTLSTLRSASTTPKPNQLSDTDVAKTQAVGRVDKGQKTLIDTTLGDFTV